MNKIFSGVSCNLDANILSACLPLFETEKIEAVEWSFDALYKAEGTPAWFDELLHAFGNEGRLIGHGVYFSLFSGRWGNEQQAWLNHLEKLSAVFRFDHISEHFGFMTGSDFHQGAPLSIPYTAGTLALGQDRLKRIHGACGCPVGLENLAFSYSADEVQRHGEFLDHLLEPVNGFLILDLHNLYCQCHNFNIPFIELIELYPLHRVREVHISGGSWEDSAVIPAQKIRRDTHDDAVPDEVFNLLRYALPRCPNLKFAVLEQLSNGLKDEESKTSFREDFLKLETIITEVNAGRLSSKVNSFLPGKVAMADQPVEDGHLHRQQRTLSHILETATDYGDALHRLQASELATSSWNVEQWQPHMLETAIAIAKKWKKGFA